MLNRSLDPKTYEPLPPPLIAQMPVQLPLLPQVRNHSIFHLAERVLMQIPRLLPQQHVITSGTAKNCIRLRGLPYEARVENILHFLEDFANNIIYQGVHMVYNAQVSDSGLRTSRFGIFK